MEPRGPCVPNAGQLLSSHCPGQPLSRQGQCPAKLSQLATAHHLHAPRPEQLMHGTTWWARSTVTAHCAWSFQISPTEQLLKMRGRSDFILSS